VKSARVLLAIVVTSTLTFPQDVQLRQEAVRLMEKADAVSTSPHLPNLERTSVFHVYGTESSVLEGVFSRVVIQGTGRRDETTLGTYHSVEVWTENGMASTETSELEPPAVRTLRGLTPIWHGRFDHEDVIHAINTQNVNGRSARCIEFDTIAGQKTDNNEICVDTANGTLLRAKVGQNLIENSEYFAFAGALLPAKISYSRAGVLQMTISQTMVELTDATANVLAAPAGAQTRQYCKTYRRPFGTLMPQPKPGTGGTDTDVIVRGIIGDDGRIHDAVVQSSDRRELDQEALNLIQQWVFTPALCDGHPNRTEASFALHFQGR
jgi:TonB family protein